MSEVAERVSNRDLATMPIEQALNFFAPNIAAVLPPEITIDHFKRIVITALNVNPDLRIADRRTLFNACVKCASDGLMPDGREAALVPYKGKVSYMPMTAGIRKRLRNSGEVKSAVAEVVYYNDKFRYRLGDDPKIDHEPASLDSDPGNPVGAYAIIVLTNGERIIEVARLKEIEAVRAQSNAPNSLMWTKFWGEGARKVVLRRAAKAAPQSASASGIGHLTQLLDRDEEDEPVAIPPRPRMVDYLEPALPDPESDTELAIEHETPIPDHEDRYFVITLDGVEEPFADPEPAVALLEDALRQAHQRNSKTVYAIWRDNETLRKQLEQDQEEALLTRLAACYKDNLTSPPNNPETPASPTLDSPPRRPLGSTPGAGDERPETALTVLKRELSKCRTRAECAALVKKHAKEIGALVAPDFEEWERHYKADFESKS